MSVKRPNTNKHKIFLQQCGHGLYLDIDIWTRAHSEGKPLPPRRRMNVHEHVTLAQRLQAGLGHTVAVFHLQGLQFGAVLGKRPANDSGLSDDGGIRH